LLFGIKFGKFTRELSVLCKEAGVWKPLTFTTCEGRKQGRA